MQTNPFKRAKAMFAAIEILQGLPVHLMQMGMAQLGEYKSRGHGRGLPGKNYLKGKNYRKPHQSTRECARRVRQMARLAT